MFPSTSSWETSGLSGTSFPRVYTLKTQYYASHYALPASVVVLIFTGARRLLLMSSLLVANKSSVQRFMDKTGS